MRESTQAASDSVEMLAAEPDALILQADELDRQGLSLVMASFELERRLHGVQADYRAEARAVPAQEPLPDAEEALVQRQAEAGAAAGPLATDRYEAREQVDLARGLPTWLTGVEPETEARRQARQAQNDARRTREIAEIEAWAGGKFEQLSALDKVGMALRLNGRRLWSKIAGITWPDWRKAGKLLVSVLDPRTTLTGVVSGLSMSLSGLMNLRQLSLAGIAQDPWGSLQNLLKSAADIATGITIVLGSITALAGIIAGIMTAITILSFGFAAPVTGPIIAFCTSVMVTVGGWTIVVGKIALILQALVLIKNLIDAACAESADGLQAQSEQIAADAGNMLNVGMQIVGARAAQVGGRGLTPRIQQAGGGVRYAAGLGARSRIATGQALRGAGRGLRTAGGFVRGLGQPGAVRALGQRLTGGTAGLVARGGRAALELPGRAVAGAGRLAGRGAEALSSLPGRAIGGAGRLLGRGAEGLSSLPGRVVGGARRLAAGAVTAPGRAVASVRGLPGRVRAGATGLRQELGGRFSRDFLVGRGIGSLGEAADTAAITRLNTRMGALLAEGTPEAVYAARQLAAERGQREASRLLRRLRTIDEGAPPASARGAPATLTQHGEYARGLHTADEVYAAYREALAKAGGREVGIYQSMDTGEFVVRVGDFGSVRGPWVGEWQAILHFHPNRGNVLTYRLPAPQDFNGAMWRFARTREAVREVVEFDIPGVGRGRTEFGFQPGRKPLYVTIRQPDGRTATLRFADVNEYQAYWSSRATYLDPLSAEYREFVNSLDDWLRDFRSEWSPPSTGQTVAGAGRPLGGRAPRVDTPELRATQLQGTQARVAGLQAEAAEEAARAAAAQERVRAHVDWTPQERAALQADLTAADARQTAALDRARREAGAATRFQNRGATPEAAAAQVRRQAALDEAHAAQAEAAEIRASLGERAQLQQAAQAAEERAAQAAREATETAASLQSQRALSARIDQLRAEENAILARNRQMAPPSGSPDGIRLDQIRRDAAAARARLAGEIEASMGLTPAIRAELRAGTPFKGPGGAEREREFLQGIPSEQRGTSGTYKDYVTGDDLPLSQLSPDHIVPVDEIFRMEGFGRLSREHQLAILDSPGNLGLLSRALNQSKQASSFLEWLRGNAALAPKLSPARIEALIALEAEARRHLQSEIARRRALMRQP
jgi:hypothetical protein